jgi:SAM-dependent methyltransferase
LAATNVNRDDPAEAATPGARECVFCGSTEFADFRGRAGARCVSCDSLERHRAMARLVAERVGLAGAGRTALEVGPVSPVVFGEYLRGSGWSYIGADKSRRGNPHDPRAVGFIDLEADLCDLGALADGSVDLVIVQCVIEEIPDYEAALAEIARVLAPTGHAMLEIPFNPAVPVSELQPPNHFGDVWRFGADLPDRVGRHLSQVELHIHHEIDYHGRVLVCRH